MNEHITYPNMLNPTLTIDETWVSLYMPLQRDQARVWLVPGEKQPQVVSAIIYGRNRIPILAIEWDEITFFEIKGEGEIVNAKAYINFQESKVPD